jgi:manganese-dependent inorganic pyrophosphatase
MKVYVIGHKSPDLDAIASAVQYAEFLKQSKRYDGAEIIAARAGEPNAETKYIFGKFGVSLPPLMDELPVSETDAFVLVDHNELTQRHEKVVAEQVTEIVDHHKVNVNFVSPVRIDVKPIGSTSSLVHELFEMYGIEPKESTLKLMLAGILSDTVGLKSSTTTGFDSTMAHDIAQKTGQNLEKLTFEIFRAKSDLTGLSAQQIAKKDFKVFDFNGIEVFINQVETVEPEKVLEMKKDLIEALNQVKAQEGAGQGYIVVTDILKINSQVIYTNDVEKRVLEKAFTTEGNNNVADIGPKMSRKKDIAPAIESVVTSK